MWFVSMVRCILFWRSYKVLVLFYNAFRLSAVVLNTVGFKGVTLLLLRGGVLRHDHVRRVQTHKEGKKQEGGCTTMERCPPLLHQ